MTEAKKIPKTAPELAQEIMTMIATNCSPKNQGVAVIFCPELQKAYEENQNIDWFCKKQCEYHRLPVQLICLDMSILKTLQKTYKK
ncbi:Uncharacterised protein [uncultured archaeon]|nr:Uncharacterised protein [uncultured archaeon]